MARLLHILKVTLGLAVACVLFGAIAGGGALTIAIAVTEGPAMAADPGWFVIGGLFGATLGAITGPAVAWLLLRRVPFGRLFTGAVVGTVIGGVAGWLVPSTPDPFVQIDNALLCAFAGFLASAVVMSVRARRFSA